MCMNVVKRYKGLGRTVYTGWKVFYPDQGKLYPQFRHHFDMIFKRKCWNGPTRRPGFHVWKNRPYPPGYPFVIKKVRFRGLLGKGFVHYTARYLWVD